MGKKSNKKREDGRIAVQVYLGRDEGGKRKYKTVYGRTQKEADAKAQELKLALNKGIDIAPELITYVDWADRWIAIKEPEVSRARAVVYQCRGILRTNSLCTFWGRTPATGSSWRKSHSTRTSTRACLKNSEG